MVQWCFTYGLWPFWQAKLLRVIIYPIVFISIFTVLFLRTDSIFCVCVCVCTVCIFYMYLIPSRRELIEYSSISTTELRAHVNVKQIRIACIKTLGEVTAPTTPGESIRRIVIGIPANAFTININSTNENTLIKANFSWEAKLNKLFFRLILKFLNFFVFSKNILITKI